jgi:hypothetical protein
MNNNVLHQVTREFWGSFAVAQRPEFWITFDYIRRYSDVESIGGFNFAMKSIQRRIPSRRPVRGIASVERTWKSAHFEGCLHLHALLWGVDGTVRNPDEFVSEIVTSSVLRLRDSRGRPMADEGTIDVQRVHEPDRVIDYATKDLNREDDKRRSRLWLITSDGVDVSTDYFH